jgi:hypothetical protein
MLLPSPKQRGRISEASADINILLPAAVVKQILLLDANSFATASVV